MTAWKDPVHEKDDKWYYWDETWSFEEGPYDSYDECQEALEEYVRDFL